MFVHGNPGSADDWRDLAEVAGRRRRALAFDLPDFGLTEAPAKFDRSVPGYAAFVDELLGELEVGSAHLVLHDFGGPIGLAWACAEPDRVAGVTLIDTGVLPDYRWHRMARIWRTPVLGELFQASATRRSFRAVLSHGEPRGLPRAFMDRSFDQLDRRTRRAVLALYRSVPDPAAQAAQVTGALRARDLPALVIWGEHDRYLPAAYAWRQREAFPSADVHVLPASGHWPFVDSPETVARLLADFWDRAPVPAASPVAS